MFTLQNTPREQIESGRLQIRPVETPHGVSLFDLSLTLSEQPGGVVCGAFEYCTDLFRRETIERMVSRFVRLLEGILSNPDAPLSGHSLLSPEEVKIAHGLDRKISRPVDGKSVVEFFQRRAQATPRAVAVVEGERRTSYSELDQLTRKNVRMLEPAKPG